VTLQPNTNLTREAQTIRVIIRFWLRMVVLLAFAAFSSIRFDQSLLLLLLMSTILSTVLATLKREQPLASVLNHWDEAITYAALGCLIIAIDFHVPS
jgi:type IV secretory pathway VirB6-like protein